MNPDDDADRPRFRNLALEPRPGDVESPGDMDSHRTYPWTPTDDDQLPEDEERTNDDEPVPVFDLPDHPTWQPRSRLDPQPTLAETPRRELPWLWPGRIPLGRVTLLVGDPGVGKSLIALDVAARVSTGRPWPGDCPEFAASAEQIGTVPLAQESSIEAGVEDNDASAEPSPPKLAPRASQLAPPPSPSSVLLLSAEDDPADTIRPRLEALGADLARIVALPPNWSPDDPTGLHDVPSVLADLRPPAERPPAPRPLDLRRDVAELEKLVVQRRDVRLVIIDPLTAYFGGVENSNHEVRRVLMQLGKLAARRRLAILAICHLRKQRGSALHRTTGSLAFAAVARAAWLVAQDPHDPDRRLLLPIKNNLAAAESGLAFTIDGAGNPLPPGEGGVREPGDAADAPVIRWNPEPITLSADEALSPAKAPMGRPTFERDDAIRWLQQALAEGAKPSADIRRAAEANGIRQTTLCRAFRELGGEAVRIGFGLLGEWYWRLPGVGEQNPDPPTLDDLWRNLRENSP